MADLPALTRARDASLDAEFKDSPEGLFFLAVVRTVLAALVDFGYKTDRSLNEIAREANSIARAVRWYTALALRCGEGMEGCFKLMKYKTAAFKSIWLDQSLPPSPVKGQDEQGAQDKPLLLVFGRAGRFVASRFRRSRGEPVDSFVATLASGIKRAFPLPTEEMLRKDERSTFEKLSTPPAESKLWLPAWSDVRDDAPSSIPLVVGKAQVVDKIRRVVEFFFPENSFTLEDRLAQPLPSTRANVDFSREEGGMWKAFLDSEKGRPLRGLRSAEGGVQLAARRANMEEEFIGAPREPEVVLVTTDLQDRLERFVGRLHADALEELPEAQPMGLAEALKVRVITKGPPLLYASMMPLQKFLWKSLARQRITQLVGRPIDERVLLDSLGSTLPDGFSYLSGDYSAATNNIKSWVSEAVANAIADRVGLTQSERELFLRSLTGHILSLDPKKHGTAEQRAQRNGQLMGSVTSFPVLCLANVALCWLSMEIGEQREIQLADLRLLVNGDDCVFVANAATQRAWIAIGNLMGLEPSLGKYFFSPRFLEMNSTLFRFGPLDPWPLAWKRSTPGRLRPLPSVPAATDDVVWRACPFTRVPFVNYGLVLGRKRSTTIQKKDDVDLLGPLGLGARHRELFATCPPEVWSAVNQRYLRTHHDRLEGECAGLPWFLPEWLGGLGLVGTPRLEDLKRALGAVYHMHEWTSAPAQLGDPNGWQVRRLAYRKLKHLPVEMLSEADAAALDDVVGRLSLSMLFSSHSLKELIAPEELQQKTAVLRQRRFLKYLGWQDSRPRFGFAKLRLPTFSVDPIAWNQITMSGVRPSFHAQKLSGFLSDADLASQDARIAATMKFIWSIDTPVFGPRVTLGPSPSRPPAFGDSGLTEAERFSRSTINTLLRDLNEDDARISLTAPEDVVLAFDLAAADMFTVLAPLESLTPPPLVRWGRSPPVRTEAHSPAREGLGL